MEICNGRKKFFAILSWYFPGGSDGKESACNAGDLSSVPGREDPLDEGMTAHSSVLAWRIPMNRAAWWPIVHEVTKSWT